MATSKTSAKRDLTTPNGDKRFIRRDDKGRIKESDDFWSPLSPLTSRDHCLRVLAHVKSE